MEKLKNLIINGNQLKSLTINDHLKQLDASDNTERSFSLSLRNNVALTSLKLSNLDIAHYDEILTAIQQLSNLENLDLSYNNLELFDFKQPRLPLALKSLNLMRSDLHSLNHWGDVKKLLPNLKEINVMDNFLSCNELNSIIKSFTSSNLNVTGLSEEKSVDDFVAKNCAVEGHKNRKRKVIEVCDRKGNGNLILLIFLIISLLGYVTGAIIYFNIFTLLKRMFSSKINHVASSPRGNLINEYENA